MSKAVIKEIKEYVDKEEYDKALTLCDKLVKQFAFIHTTLTIPSLSNSQFHRRIVDVVKTR